MSDLILSQLFCIPLKSKVMKTSHDISWSPPDLGCVKLNCDGSTFGTPSDGSIGFVLRDANSGFLGAMVQNIGYASSLDAEFSACMLAIEKLWSYI